MPSLTEIRHITVHIASVFGLRQRRKRTLPSSKPPKGYGYKNFPK